MAAGLILQFPASVGEKEYDAVNSKLRFDPRTGKGDWPAGLLSHSAGKSDQGLIVTEIWESKQAQAAFMESQWGAALADLPEPTVLWFDLLAGQHGP
jgi:hypothetical protein